MCLSVPAAILGRQFWGVPEILAHSVRMGLDLLPLPSLHRFSSVDGILEPELQCEDKGHGGGGRVWGELSWEKQRLVTRVPAESVWAGPRGGLRSNPSALLTTRWPREAPSGLPSLLCGAEVGVWGILQSVSQWAISSSLPPFLPPFLSPYLRTGETSEQGIICQNLATVNLFLKLKMESLLLKIDKYRT